MKTLPKPGQLDARLHRLLGGDELAALRMRLRRYFERRDDSGTATGSSGGEDGVLRLTKLSAVEQEAVSLLMGRPARTSRAPSTNLSARIDVAVLNALLQGAGIAASLRDALEQLDGPIVNRLVAKEELQARWAQAVNTPIGHGALQAWLLTPAALSLLKRLARQDPDTAAKLLERTDAVLQKLPAQGLTRAQLAADTLGNAHALDNGQPTATLVLAVLQKFHLDLGEDADAAHLADRTGLTVPGYAAIEEASPPSTERARDTWARVGVLVNELARPALYLNLPTHAGDPIQPQAGEPGFLSLRQLLRTTIAWDVAGLPVFVCENPNIVSIAADRLGANCAPMVCTEGMPAAAQRVLLTQLAQAGARLRYHGDFDWAGLQIANHVIALCAAQPWRFGCADYAQAVNSAPHTKRDLGDSMVSAVWDEQLATTMHLFGLAIAEEAVVARLLPDLRNDQLATTLAAGTVQTKLTPGVGTVTKKPP
jgi:uncharacterized protein (TIGR02679 family)